MKFKKDADGKLVLDDDGNPIAIDGDGNTIPLDKVVSLGKHQRIEGERDEYKAKVATLEGQIAELGKGAGTAEELKAKIEELTAKTEADKADFEAKLSDRDKESAAKEREYTLDTALLGAGVPSERLKAAKALIDSEKVTLADGKLSGFDAESFKKDNAYLFETPREVSTGAASRGAAGGDEQAETRKLMGLPETKE